MYVRSVCRGHLCYANEGASRLNEKTFNVPSVPSSLNNHKSSLSGKRRTDCAKTNYCAFVLAVVKSTDLLRAGALF